MLNYQKKPELGARVCAVEPESEARVFAVEPESEARVWAVEPESKARVCAVEPDSVRVLIDTWNMRKTMSIRFLTNVYAIFM